MKLLEMASLFLASGEVMIYQKRKRDGRDRNVKNTIFLDEDDFSKPYESRDKDTKVRDLFEKVSESSQVNRI